MSKNWTKIWKKKIVKNHQKLGRNLKKKMNEKYTKLNKSSEKMLRNMKNVEIENWEKNLNGRKFCKTRYKWVKKYRKLMKNYHEKLVKSAEIWTKKVIKCWKTWKKRRKLLKISYKLDINK